MKVSVVIPLYNQAASLELTLHAFNQQDYNDGQYEVIVVDDGSTEACSISEADYQFPLTLIRQDNLGRAAARNTGIQASSSELVIFNDADRIPDRYFIARHTAIHEQAENTVVVGKPKEVYISNIDQRLQELKEWIDHGRIPKISRDYAYEKKVMTKLYGIDSSFSKSPIPWIGFFSGNVSVKRRDLHNIGMFNEEFINWGFEHFELGYRFYHAGFKFYYCRNAINYHLAHSRPGNFYDEHFYESTQIFKRVSNDPNIDYLYLFMTGKLSLEQLEQVFGGSSDKWEDAPGTFFSPM